MASKLQILKQQEKQNSGPGASRSTLSADQYNRHPEGRFDATRSVTLM
jgi:hypothetical protein